MDTNDSCPKDHVKIKGVSMCMKRRDICKQCPPLTPVDPADCENGKIVTETDGDGCKISK